MSKSFIMVNLVGPCIVALIGIIVLFILEKRNK
jgi:hypothetical protein